VLVGVIVTEGVGLGVLDLEDVPDFDGVTLGVLDFDGVTVFEGVVVNVAVHVEVSVLEEVKVRILLEVPDWENEILEDEDPNVVSVDKYVDKLEILVVPLSDNEEYPVDVEVSLIEIVSLDVLLSDGEFDIVLMLVWVSVLSEVKSPLFVLLPPLLILELPDCILVADDDKLSVSVNFGVLEILYVNVSTGDKVIVDFIVFVEVFVINGDFEVDKLIVGDDVIDEEREFILFVFVGEFVVDDDILVVLVIDTVPLEVLEVLEDLVFVTDEDDDAVAEDDLEWLVVIVFGPDKVCNEVELNVIFIDDVSVIELVVVKDSFELDDIVRDIIDVRVGFLFVADEELLIVFKEVDLVEKDIEGVAELLLEFVCVRVSVVDDVPLLVLVVDNVDVPEFFGIVFVPIEDWEEVFELLIDLEFVGVNVEVFVVVIVLVPDDEPDEDFVDVNEPLEVFVIIIDIVSLEVFVNDGELEDVFELLIERVFVVELVDDLVGLVVIVDEGELDVVLDVVIEVEDDFVFLLEKEVKGELDIVLVSFDVIEHKFEEEDVLVTVEVLVDVFDAVWVLVFLDVSVISLVTIDVFVPVVVLVDVLDCVGDNDGKIILLSPIPLITNPLNNKNNNLRICIYILNYAFLIHISIVLVFNELNFVLLSLNCSEAFSTVSEVKETYFLISRKGPWTFIEGNCNLIGGDSQRTISFVSEI